MTKDEIVNAVMAEEACEHLDEADIQAVIDATIAAVTEGLAKGDRVTLGPLGVFSTRHEGAHMVTVPGQAEPVEVAAHERVLFHPSPTLAGALAAGAEDE